MEQNCDRGRNAVDQADLANLYLLWDIGFFPWGDLCCTARTLRCFDELSRRRSCFDAVILAKALPQPFGHHRFEHRTVWLQRSSSHTKHLRRLLSEIAHRGFRRVTFFKKPFDCCVKFRLEG